MDSLKKSLREIFVIVFSVLLATYLENIRQKMDEAETAREFLDRLKVDLQNDIQEMRNDQISYHHQRLGFLYFLGIEKPGDLHPDSVKKYQVILYNHTSLVPNNGGYEGFRSSGKLYSIQDRELRAAILDLYQERIPMLIASTTSYYARKQRLSAYVEDELVATDLTHLTEFLTKPKVRNLMHRLVGVQEILDRYNLMIKDSEQIISRIEKRGR